MATFSWCMTTSFLVYTYRTSNVSLCHALFSYANSRSDATQEAHSLPTAWNQKDNIYFLPASYMEHMIGTYSSVTDAVIYMKSIAL